VAAGPPYDLSKTGRGSMHVLQIATDALAVGPRLRSTPNGMVARSSLLLEVLSLFSWGLHIEVDRERGRISIHTKRFWRRAASRHVAFADLRYIWRVARRLTFGPTEQTTHWERYRVILELREGEKVELFSFLGESTDRSGWGKSVLVTGDTIDLDGNQAEQSIAFARQLAKLTNAELMDAPF
jgi:hypothetical protein